MISKEQKEAILAMHISRSGDSISKDVYVLMMMDVVDGSIWTIVDLSKLMGYKVGSRLRAMEKRGYLRLHGVGAYSIGRLGRRYLKRYYVKYFDSIMDLRSVINGINADI
jgi:hypothetical protein